MVIYYLEPYKYPFLYDDFYRLLDLKNGKHVDCDVLEILVKAIDENLPDNYERPSKSFKKAALALFGRLTSENNGESRVWQLYAQLVTSAETQETLNEEDLFKAAQFMQKATATFMQTEKNWHKSTQNITKGLCLAAKYMTSKWLFMLRLFQQIFFFFHFFRNSSIWNTYFGYMSI